MEVYNFYGRGGSFDEQVSTDAPKAYAELLVEFWKTDVVYYDESFGDVDGEMLLTVERITENEKK